MTPADIKAARKALGLSQDGLAGVLRLGSNGGRTVRRWEAGDVAITGPAAVALELMLRDSGSHAKHRDGETGSARKGGRA